jgi:hypothetical protein
MRINTDNLRSTNNKIRIMFLLHDRLLIQTAGPGWVEW